MDVIKFVSTSWLCLELSVNREVKKYVGLKCYFELNNVAGRRFKLLQSSFNNPMTKVYFLFNKLLQRKEPLIIKLFDSQQRFIPKFAFRFIKANVIQHHKDSGNSFLPLSLDIQDQREDIKLGIGIVTC